MRFSNQWAKDIIINESNNISILTIIKLLTSVKYSLKK